jgi:hypothetical protein
MTNAFPRLTGVLPAAAAALAFGCAVPDETAPELAPESTVFQAQAGPSSLDDPRAAYAALVADGSGGTSIRLLDGAGNPGLSIPVPVPFADRLTAHPDGFFIVKAQRSLYRVEVDGSAELFTDAPFLWLYGATASADGTVSVAAETEIVELDADGNVVSRLPTGGTYCWMDVSVSTQSEAGDTTPATVVDLWGSTLAAFTPSERQVDVLARLPFGDIDITAVDSEGSHWFARTDDGLLYAWDADAGARTVAAVGSDSVDGVRALLPAQDGTMTVIVQEAEGVRAVRVHIDGTVEPRFTVPSALWMDVTPLF